LNRLEVTRPKPPLDAPEKLNSESFHFEPEFESRIGDERRPLAIRAGIQPRFRFCQMVADPVQASE
jgi:hypothetical protein